MADISDTVNKIEKEKEPEGLAGKIDSRLTEQKETSIGEIALGAAVTTAGLLSVYHFLGMKYLAGSIFGVTAYSTAYMTEVLRGKVKFSFKDLIKEGATGGTLGAGAIALYGAFHGVGANTLSQRIAKTAKYMTSIAAVLPLYRGMVYFRDKIGVRNTFKSLGNGKWKQYVKDAWKYDISQNWGKMALALFAVASIPEYFILNYIKSDIWKVAAGKAFSFVTRLIVGGKSAIKDEAKVDAKKSNYGLADRVGYDDKKSNYLPKGGKTRQLSKYGLEDRLASMKDKYAPQNNYSLAA